MSLYEPVRQCMSQHFNIPVEEITTNATLNDLGMDSLALIELVCVLKEEVHPGLSDADVAVTPDSTFSQAVQAVEAAVASLNAPTDSFPSAALRAAVQK
ncbi:acyl carrier protein [Streptomyces flavidovirens]|uniref:acyl carrier protein n=1 Tax=Streptomyces flavidovirens TaxID=67298 RepID=UPI00367C7618